MNNFEISTEEMQWIIAAIAGLSGGVVLRNTLGENDSYKAQMLLCGISVLVVIILYIRERFFVNIRYGVLEPIIATFILVALIICIFIGTLMQAYILPESQLTTIISSFIMIAASSYTILSVFMPSLFSNQQSKKN